MIQYSEIYADRDDFKSVVRPIVNKEAYDKKLKYNANVISVSTTTSLWPVKTVYPTEGALLPFNRIVAYYGNFLSTRMGVLGEYPEPVMLEKLAAEIKKWEEADPNTPVIPAIDYIAITAQGVPGDDGMYRARMSSAQIKKALDLAEKIKGIVILEVQVGLSDLMSEVMLLEPYWKLPNVHLAVDPEFAMKKGTRPGKVIGTVDASDLNYIAEYLQQVVLKNNIPPKIIVVHRFTDNMVTNSHLIKPLPEVQFIIDMDGWGYPAQKIQVYKREVTEQPVQFGGIKLFYKNDLFKPSPGMMTTSQVLKLTPAPIFIQYQ